MKRYLSILPIFILIVTLMVLTACRTPAKPEAGLLRPETEVKPSTNIPEPGTFRTENIILGSLAIVGVEHLEPYELFGNKGWNVYYEFLVLDENRESTRYIVSFGSYDATNELFRRQGNLPAGQRLYHLDVYDFDPVTKRVTGHTTLRFQRSEERPSYDTIRDEALQYIETIEFGED